MDNRIQITTAFLAVLALIVSICGVFYQEISVSYQKKENELAIQDMLIERNSALLEIMIQNPDLRPFFYNNEDLPENDTEMVNKVLVLAELWTDFFEHVAIQLPYLYDLGSSWEEYARDMHKTSPAIKKHLDQKCSWYAADLEKLLGCN